MSETIRSADLSLLKYTLDRPVGGSGVAAVDVVLVDLKTSEGRSAWGFSYSLGGEGMLALKAAASLLRSCVVGKAVSHPEHTSRLMRSALNRIGRGVHSLGMCAIDIAMWDLWSTIQGISIGASMGGTPRKIKIYGSGNFNTSQSPQEAAEAAAEHLEAGFTAVKPRLSGSMADFAVLDAVAAEIGAHSGLMIDTNEKCSLEQALRLKAAATEHRVLFFEEPIAALDLCGYEQLKNASGVPIATGEHLQGLVEASPFITEGLCAVIQPDVAAMGGLTECLRVSRLAEAHGISVAPHFLPHLFIHLAAASPAVTWLEDFPLLEPLFGELTPYDQTGDLALNDSAIGLGFELSSDSRRQFTTETDSIRSEDTTR